MAAGRPGCPYLGERGEPRPRLKRFDPSKTKPLCWRCDKYEGRGELGLCNPCRRHLLAEEETLVDGQLSQSAGPHSEPDA
jgi:hypothetical protein